MNTGYLLPALTIVTTALIAGLYYAYSCSVNPGLGALPDKEYVAAMQSINRAIQNPLFFFSFFGALVLLPMMAYRSYSAAPDARFYCLLAATVIYAIGSFGVTVLGNVPLNNALAAFKGEGTTAEAWRAARAAFEPRWNTLHTIRTLATVLALVLAVVGCLQPAARAR